VPDIDSTFLTTRHDDQPAADPTAGDVESFADLGVADAIVSALTSTGITRPFPIQSMTLPVALSGHDIIGQAKTGTGKTLGFGIPVLQQVTGPEDPGFDAIEAPGKPQALIVTPTRELAVQVAGDLKTAGRQLPTRILTVYGGRAYDPQIEALRRGVEIVVGTPGRLLDLAQQGHLTLAHTRTVVLDEADEMLDLGFLPDIERILAMTPTGRQMMLFSATMPGAIVALARRYMTQPTHIRAADPEDSGATVKAVKQLVYRAHAMDKTEMIARILQASDRGLTMIFARTKRTVAKVADELGERGFAAAAIHGDLGQGAREQALRAFRNGKVDVLVATDVAARGIDVDDVSHVINYQCPEDEKTYLHRIGRTARAGNKGTAITFVDWDDLTRWNLISTILDLGMSDPPETYSSSLHLFTDLDIPEGTRGRLPRASRTRAGLEAEKIEDLGETGARQRGGTPGRAAARGRSRNARDDSPEVADGPRRPRRVRQRRRTRGGKVVERGGQPMPPADESPVTEAPSTATGQASVPVPPSTDAPQVLLDLPDVPAVPLFKAPVFDPPDGFLREPIDERGSGTRHRRRRRGGRETSQAVLSSVSSAQCVSETSSDGDAPR
jgi:superfamily II DNA/RNA helicase